MVVPAAAASAVSAPLGDPATALLLDLDEEAVLFCTLRHDRFASWIAGPNSESTFRLPNLVGECHQTALSIPDAVLP
jgi:hypothetical protein